MGLRDVPNSKGRQCLRRGFQVLISVEKGMSGHHHDELSVQKGADLCLCLFCVRLPSFHTVSSTYLYMILTIVLVM